MQDALPRAQYNVNIGDTVISRGNENTFAIGTGNGGEGSNKNINLMKGFRNIGSKNNV